MPLFETEHSSDGVFFKIEVMLLTPFPPAYLISLGIAKPLLLRAQVTHFGHQFIRMDEEARTEQEGEDVCPLLR